MHALSLKQPWAALLVHGLKTIEVRRWPTARRGRVLIHAARVPDERPEAWALVPPSLRAAAGLTGGIVGAGELTGCKTYRSRKAFAADQAAHLNDPSWFGGSPLYGFLFADLCALPFRACPGWMRFFPVPAEVPPSDDRPGLLVSVRSAEEVEAALAGGAALIDVKEPANGALGAADVAVIQTVLQQAAGRRPVSAALGELGELRIPDGLARLAFAKWGLAGCGRRADWPGEWLAAAARLQRAAPACRPVAVAYADWRRAESPAPEEVCAFAAAHRCAALLLDTWQKDGRTLLNHLSVDEVTALCQRCRQAGVRIALAGSLGAKQILALREARPSWFAVRGAACAGGERGGCLDAAAVRFLADVVARLPVTAAARGS
jgi:uncharacterized protein (UPF0264 family)